MEKTIECREHDYFSCKTENPRSIDLAFLFL